MLLIAECRLPIADCIVSASTHEELVDRLCSDRRLSGRIGWHIVGWKIAMETPSRNGARIARRLRYTAPQWLCIERIPRGDTFRYRLGHRFIRRGAELNRIKSLAIPPAWTDVRICRDRHGHLQAVGRDARGRKQYIYHPEWRRIRDEKKYTHLIQFGRRLPRIRRHVNRDLRQRHPTKTLILAVVTRLLETGCIRVGNEEYAKANRSFGLTTLRDRHVRVRGSTLRMEFQGKSGKRHRVTVSDARLARVVARCLEIPGQELFQYFDEQGRRHKIKSNDVNEYLRGISGGDFTAKDFRTWVGTVLMAKTLRARGWGDSLGHARTNVKEALKIVAAQLGNTPSICQKSYVHPAVIDAYLARVEELDSGKQPNGGRRKRNEEAALLRLLGKAPVQLSLQASLRRVLKHAAKNARKS